VTTRGTPYPRAVLASATVPFTFSSMDWERKRVAKLVKGSTRTTAVFCGVRRSIHQRLERLDQLRLGSGRQHGEDLRLDGRIGLLGFPTAGPALLGQFRTPHPPVLRVRAPDDQALAL
jgi:hypothetical protein